MVKRSGAFLHLCSFSINAIIEVDVYVRADISTIDDQWRLHMKKWFCALGMMLALLMSVALADVTLTKVYKTEDLCREKRANQRRL